MSDTLLDAMHEALTAELLKRITDGTATASDLSVARQFLKDNGIDADANRAPKNSPLGQLTEKLPFDDDAVVPMFNR